MKPHTHEHAHDAHDHGHGTHEHHEADATVKRASTHAALSRHSREGGNPNTDAHNTQGANHHHGMDSRLRGNDGRFGGGLLMTSSAQRVLGALGLIAGLWLAVAWAVL